jgi:hypothetical protein
MSYLLIDQRVLVSILQHAYPSGSVAERFLVSSCNVGAHVANTAFDEKRFSQHSECGQRLTSSCPVVHVGMRRFAKEPEGRFDFSALDGYDPVAAECSAVD